MAEYTQEYLETLTKSQRGEIWIKSVLSKAPNYDTAKLWEIWEECENTVETYEQEANKSKWLEEYLAESDASGIAEFKDGQDIWSYIDTELDKKYAKKQV